MTDSLLIGLLVVQVVSLALQVVLLARNNQKAAQAEPLTQRAERTRSDLYRILPYDVATNLIMSGYPSAASLRGQDAKIVAQSAGISRSVAQKAIELANLEKSSL